MLEDADWLDNKTKHEAQHKLSAMKQFVGYPDEILDKNVVDELFDGVEMDEETTLETASGLSSGISSLSPTQYIFQLASCKEWPVVRCQTISILGQLEYIRKEAKCIIDQYSQYYSTGIGMQVNGIATQGENIADNGGVKAAYHAYGKL
ncbi:unnamed protein product [Sphagnum tenellum]